MVSGDALYAIQSGFGHLSIFDTPPLLLCQLSHPHPSAPKLTRATLFAAPTGAVRDGTDFGDEGLILVCKDMQSVLLSQPAVHGAIVRLWHGTLLDDALREISRVRVVTGAVAQGATAGASKRPPVSS